LARRDGLHLPALAGGDQHDEAGQVFRFRAQSVEHPRTHAWPAGNNRSCVHDGVGGVVIDLLSPHRANDADVVGDAADMGKQFAKLQARLSEPLEAVLGAKAKQLFPLQLRQLLALRK
jgi:hypothetical protein